MKKLLKKQISKLVSILVLTLSTTSCNYLDVIPDNIPTIDMAKYIYLTEEALTALIWD